VGRDTVTRCFIHDAEDIGLGPGKVYLEFEGEWATRQVEVYRDRWLCSMVDYHPGIGAGLVDQPLSVLELGPDNEISREEFERIWIEAMTRSEDP
jgi:hypothetical protein